MQNGTETVQETSKNTVVWSLILFCLMMLICLVMIFIFIKKLVSREDDSEEHLLDEDRTTTKGKGGLNESESTSTI